MFYCVTSIYRAGGRVSRVIDKVYSDIKPHDFEKETPFHIIVKKYFNTRPEALEYIGDKI